MELMSLEHRRSELRAQLKSLNVRRARLDMQYREAGPARRSELAPGVKELDDRSTRIQNQLDAADDRVLALLARGVSYPPPSLLTPAPSVAVAPAVQAFDVGSSDPFNSEWGELFGGILALQGLTFVLLGIVVWRSFRRHVSTRLAGADASRLEQLQRSVDVMAVEVERIAESQRFTAKLLNEQVAEPVRLGKDAERVR
jgi:hypothetical protein